MATIKKRTWIIASASVAIVVAIGLIAYFAMTAFASTDMSKVYEVAATSDYVLQNTKVENSLISVNTAGSASKDVQMETIYPAPNPMMIWKSYSGTPTAPLDPTKVSEATLNTGDVTRIQDTSLSSGLDSPIGEIVKIYNGTALEDSKTAPYPMYFTIKPRLNTGDTINSIDFTLTQLPGGALVTAGKDLATLQTAFNEPATVPAYMAVWPPYVPECNPTCNVAGPTSGLSAITITPETEIYVGVKPFMRLDNPYYATANKYFLGGIQAKINYTPVDKTIGHVYPSSTNYTDSTDINTLWNKITIPGPINVPANGATASAAKLQWFSADTVAELNARTTLVSDPTTCIVGGVARCSRAIELQKLGSAPFGDLSNALKTDGTANGIYPKGRFGKFVIKMYAPNATLNPTVFNQIQISYVVQTPTPPPTVALLTKDATGASVDKTTITKGTSAQLSWAIGNITDLSKCSASPTGWWIGLTGIKDVTPLTTTTYKLSCTNAGGVDSKEVVVTVVAGPPPTVDLTGSLPANPTNKIQDAITVVKGSQATLNWAITNAAVSECKANTTGWWNNTLNSSATVTPVATAPATTVTYQLSCTTVNGTASDQIIVTLIDKPLCPTVTGVSPDYVNHYLYKLKVLGVGWEKDLGGTQVTITGSGFGTSGKIREVPQGMLPTDKNYSKKSYNVTAKSWADDKIVFNVPRIDDLGASVATPVTVLGDEAGWIGILQSAKDIFNSMPTLVKKALGLPADIVLQFSNVSMNAAPYHFDVSPATLPPDCKTPISSKDIKHVKIFYKFNLGVKVSVELPYTIP